MQNELMSKWSLFITSYLPLYLWLFFSNINYSDVSVEKIIGLQFQHKILRLVLGILIIVSIWKIYQLFKLTGTERSELPEGMEVSPESDSLMNYIVTYFTPLISFNLSETKSVTMNILLFILIGLMYVGGSASYLNPVLGVFGFKIFEVTGLPNAHHIISNLSFDEIETIKKRKDKVIRYRLGDGIFIVKRGRINNEKD